MCKTIAVLFMLEISLIHVKGTGKCMLCFRSSQYRIVCTGNVIIKSLNGHEYIGKQLINCLIIQIYKHIFTWWWHRWLILDRNLWHKSTETFVAKVIFGTLKYSWNIKRENWKNLKTKVNQMWIQRLIDFNPDKNSFFTKLFTRKFSGFLFLKWTSKNEKWKRNKIRK